MTTRPPPDSNAPPHPAPHQAPHQAPDPAALARDWITLVQTELAGLASDREALETWQGLAAMWGRTMAGLVPPAAPAAHDPARAAAAAAAPGAGGGDAVLARLDALERRLAAIEQRLDGLERAGTRRRRAPPG